MLLAALVPVQTGQVLVLASCKALALHMQEVTIPMLMEISAATNVTEMHAKRSVGDLSEELHITKRYVFCEDMLSADRGYPLTKSLLNPMKNVPSFVAS